jgi:hypothetical protein
MLSQFGGGRGQGRWSFYGGMIRKKPAPHLMRGGYRFSEKIMPKQNVLRHMAWPDGAAKAVVSRSAATKYRSEAL